MFKPFIDLHTHTTRSDGRLTPEELVQAAYETGIRVMSITDHNYTEDLSELRSQFPEMTLIQGAEVSALYSDSTGNEHELHIVALGFDPQNMPMQQMLVRNQADRRPYIEKILAKLRENGINLGSYEDILTRCNGTNYIGLLDLARFLFEDGYTDSIDQSFDLYLGTHGQCRYIKNPLRYDSLEHVVQTIIRANGIPILAHLLEYDLDNGNKTGGPEKNKLVRYFQKLAGGHGGLEVYYARYNTMQRLYLLQMARKYGLLVSAGSDYHHQSETETLAHRISYAACSDLLDHLCVNVDCEITPSDFYILSGFSGVGKGTIASHLANMTINNKPIAIIRSVTNRPPRSAHENYTFLSPKAFTEIVESHQLLEYTSYNKNSYGTPMWEIRSAIEAGKSPLLEIDCIGFCRLLTEGKIDPSRIRSVFVVAPADEVANRLCLRGTENKKSVTKRLETAILEADFLHLYDAIVINIEIDQALKYTLLAYQGHPIKPDFNAETFKNEMRKIIAAQLYLEDETS